jgi:CBS domain containing-hemolysin-like protein
MEDILEEIVGDIWDEHDEIIEQISRIDDLTFRVKGNADLGDIFEALEMEEEPDFATVNGWVMEELGRIPVVGDEFTFKNLKVSVTSADTKRVMEVIIQVLPVESREDEE